MFLVTRPQGSATKEQVLEALWPDLSPSAAFERLEPKPSLHATCRQTWYVDGESADYVAFQNELLWITQSALLAP